MHKQEFEKIIDNIDDICVDVKRIRVNIKAIKVGDLACDDFVNLDDYISKTSEYQSKIDKILKSEFYHIIGMGDLSASQTISLCKKVKELGKVEDINKRNSTCLSALKAINTSLTGKSSYKLTEMIVLKLN